MTLTQFDNGYWYVTELKEFAETIGIPSAGKLRKDELEKAITLRLRLDLPVALYTNDKATKDFLEREAQKLAPGVKRKSGVRYRLNRWREERLVKGVKLSYGDLVKEYVRLNQTREDFAQIPIRCYVNFMSDFFAAQKGATRAQAMNAWRKLKTLDIPKDYRSWVESQSQKVK